MPSVPLQVLLKIMHTSSEMRKWYPLQTAAWHWTSAQAGAAKKELRKTTFRRLNLGMVASSAALLAVRAVHSDLQTPVADILTVVQAGLTGAPCHAFLQPAPLHCSCIAVTQNYSLLTDGWDMVRHVVDLQLGSRSIPTL
jgi:hypothetical protein